MLYRIGTAKEIDSLPSVLPIHAYRELVRCTSILDYEYGVDRDYMEVGGYSLIAETEEDIQEFKSVVDYERHFPEWTYQYDNYAAALYLMNDDFSIVIFIPLEVAPKEIMDELKEG